MAEPTAPSRPPAPAAVAKPTKHPRLGGVLRFLKGALYAIPIINILPITYDAISAGRKYSASRKEGNLRRDALLDTGYSGGAAALGASSYLSYLAKPLKWLSYLTFIPAIGYMLSGLKNVIAPKKIDNPARGEKDYVNQLYTTPRTN